MEPWLNYPAGDPLADPNAWIMNPATGSWELSAGLGAGAPTPGGVVPMEAPPVVSPTTEQRVDSGAIAPLPVPSDYGSAPMTDAAAGYGSPPLAPVPQTAFGLQADNTVPQLGPVPLGGSTPPPALANAPTGSVVGTDVGYGASQGGSYTGGGSGGSSLSTGRSTIPAGSQSEWSQALHQSGALSDPRSNPIPFGAHPQASSGMYDQFLANTQGGAIPQGAPPPQVGGYDQSMPGSSGGGPIPSPAMQPSPPPIPMGAQPMPIPGGQVTPPDVAMQDPGQMSMLAGQMNQMMRRRYGGF